ncbi:hypothetical protein V6N12_020103 [Hibiscus sabdariffa]|uniref:Mitochondrial import inner membrane translocase subunit n=1 Tax=Hibiscus sabdariffa TaxID=183260 RepID=A0ABR1ZSQ3_9ROSI
MDKNMLAGLEGLPEEDKNRMSAMIDHLQLRDSLRMYNSLVERCFNDCVDNFTRKTLQKQEETCVARCAEKFLKHSMRVGLSRERASKEAAFLPKLAPGESQAIDIPVELPVSILKAVSQLTLPMSLCGAPNALRHQQQQRWTLSCNGWPH